MSDDTPLGYRPDPVENPYAPPKSALGPTGPDAGSPIENAEAIRREHLSHEATIKSLGCLYYWSGVLTAILAVLLLAGSVLVAVTGIVGADEMMIGGGFLVAFSLLYAFLAWLNIWIGRGLRRLDPRVRVLLTIFLVLGAVFVLVAWLLTPQDVVTPTISLGLTAFFLWALYGRKGRVVLSPEYRQIVAQTPHLKYRTPKIFWLIVILAFVVLIVAAVMGTLGA